MKQLGQILVEQFGVDPGSIGEALDSQVENGRRIGELLVQQKKISEDNLLHARSIQSGLDLLTALPAEPDPFFIDRVPIGFLKKYMMMPVATSEECYIALAEPYYFQQLDDLTRVLQWDGIKTVLAPQEEIYLAINTAYDMGNRDAADQVMQDIDEEDPESILSEIEETADLLDDTSDAPVIKLVNLVLSQAVRDNASDIHIEPYKDRVKIRKRVDGILYDMYSPPKHVQSKLISRVKIMARMDIAEKRLPQDGRIEIRIADKNIDLRVSTLPTAFGERVVMRLLDKSSVLLSLEVLGMGRNDLDRFEQLIKRPYGIILVTGPTGSGKTTTLYSALSILNQPGVNIITVEDPIEYQLPGVGQLQVNPKIGLTFAHGLRSILRQDPDVIIVGEIRHVETAKIAVQAALTGHLVFSTLHTNDSAGALARLVEMGVEPFLASSALVGVLAQRLVRTICPHCRMSYRPEEKLLAELAEGNKLPDGATFYRGRGCSHCMKVGYLGRTGLYELLEVTDPIRRLVNDNADAATIRQQALKLGMRPLRQAGLAKVLAGQTTVEEVLRVTQEEV
ncbi:MAG: type II secretion system ATPase GspE [Desulfobulbaceae bacterium]|nr:type II secretion system ATPase GspE [Desulfobulbaceae bacterium]